MRAMKARPGKRGTAAEEARIFFPGCFLTVGDFEEVPGLFDVNPS